jgi:hypothetical protein
MKWCLGARSPTASRCPIEASFVSLAVKPVGKPDALIGHVRFDERGWETGRRSVRQCSRPSSTLQVVFRPPALVRLSFTQESDDLPTLWFWQMGKWRHSPIQRSISQNPEQRTGCSLGHVHLVERRRSAAVRWPARSRPASLPVGRWNSGTFINSTACWARCRATERHAQTYKHQRY